MLRFCTLLLTLLIALPALHAADEAFTEFALQLGHSDTGDIDIATRQLKKAGAKAVPALKAALKEAQDPGYKVRLNEILDWCENSGKPVNGISIKLTASKTSCLPGEKIQFRIQYLNHTDQPLVVRLGQVSGLPYKQLKEGSAEEKAYATQIFYDHYKKSGEAYRTMEFPLNFVQLLAPLETSDDGERRALHYKCPDGRNYVPERPRTAYAVVPALGKIENTIQVAFNERAVKPKASDKQIQQVFAIKPDPCIFFKAKEAHSIRVHLEEGDEAPKDSVEHGDHPDAPKRYQGIGAYFKTSADHWSGTADSNEVEITLKESGDFP